MAAVTLFPDLPAPLTPPDCDLRGLPFMPMDTIRVLDSDLFAASTGEEFKAAFSLWCKSWQQVPAGSLPNDDRILAHLSGAGSRWSRVKEAALRNWVRCSDGRLYHPVVCEKALEALPMRLDFKEKKTGEAERKAKEREDRKVIFAQLRAVGIVPAWDTKTRELRELVTKHVTQPVTEKVTPVTAVVTVKTGTGTGTESLEEDDAADAGVAIVDPFDLLGFTDDVCRAAGIRHIDPGTIGKHIALVKAWVSEGFDPATEIMPAVRDAIATADGRVNSLKYFDTAIRQAKARREADHHGTGTRDRSRRPARVSEMDAALARIGAVP